MQPYVEAYWLFSGTIDNIKSTRVLPDGCIDLLFSFSSHYGNRPFKLFQPYVIGAMTSFQENVYQGDVELFGIRFKPGRIREFLRCPVDELTDLHVEASEVCNLFDSGFIDRLESITTSRERVMSIDRYLAGKVGGLAPPDTRVLHAVGLIKESGGLITPEAISRAVSLSKRQFERVFKQGTGMSPKTFCSIARFRRVRDLLKQQPGEKLHAYAIDCGYSDHAHMTREFKRFSGDTPSDM